MSVPPSYEESSPQAVAGDPSGLPGGYDAGRLPVSGESVRAFPVGLGRSATEPNPKTDQSDPHEGMLLERIFAEMGGFEWEILTQYCLPHDRIVAARLGMVVLVPFFLGIVAGGYTLYATTGNRMAALIGGLIWGGIILTIDLAVMPQLTKSVLPESDGGYYNTPWGQFQASFSRIFRHTFGSTQDFLFPLMRIAMAIILGILVSEIVVLGFFSGRLATQIHADWMAELRGARGKLLEQNKSGFEYLTLAYKKIEDSAEQARQLADEERVKALSELDARPTYASNKELTEAEAEISALEVRDRSYKSQISDKKIEIEEANKMAVDSGAAASKQKYHGSPEDNIPAGEGELYNQFILARDSAVAEAKRLEEDVQKIEADRRANQDKLTEAHRKLEATRGGFQGTISQQKQLLREKIESDYNTRLDQIRTSEEEQKGNRENFDRAAKEQSSSLNNQIKLLDAKIEALESVDLRLPMTLEVNSSESVVETRGDILAQFEALQRLKRTGSTESKGIFPTLLDLLFGSGSEEPNPEIPDGGGNSSGFVAGAISWFHHVIVISLITIDILPVLLKGFRKPMHYDYVLHYNLERRKRELSNDFYVAY